MRQIKTSMHTGISLGKTNHIAESVNIVVGKGSVYQAKGVRSTRVAILAHSERLCDQFRTIRSLKPRPNMRTQRATGRLRRPTKRDYVHGFGPLIVCRRAK